MPGKREGPSIESETGPLFNLRFISASLAFSVFPASHSVGGVDLRLFPSPILRHDGDEKRIAIGVGELMSLQVRAVLDGSLRGEGSRSSSNVPSLLLTADVI